MQWEPTARRQHGVIGRAQLRGTGRSPRQVARLYKTGPLERHRRSVYVDRAAPITFEAALWSAVLATRGTLGYATAAFVWKMIDEPNDRIDVIVAEAPGRRSPLGIRLYRTQLLATDCTVAHGLPVTTRSCSALDYLGRLARGPALTFADRALQQNWIARADIERRLTVQKGRTGNGRLRQILEITSDGAAAKSERLLHAILRSGAIEGWVANLKVDLGESYCELDVGFREVKLGIEIDGMAYHVDSDRFQNDRTKQSLLGARGWQVLRYTWSDLVNRPGWVLRTISDTIQARKYL